MAEALELPAGLGFLRVNGAADQICVTSPDQARETYFNRLWIWERPRKECTYIMPVDVGGGQGQDRSVIDILREGSLSEPDEQVAQFVTDSIDAITLAGYIDAIGRLYPDAEGTEALAAIEINNQGLATQTTLMQHFGYSNLFIWRHEDQVKPQNRWSRAYGWATTWRTRPQILAAIFKAVTTFDENTELPDFRFHSPLLLQELRDFQAPSHGPIWEAAAPSDGHDDAVITCSIGIHIAQTRRWEGGEPLSETRRRLAEENQRKKELAARSGLGAPSYQNTAVTGSLTDLQIITAESMSQIEVDWDWPDMENQ